MNEAVKKVLDDRSGDHFFLYVHYLDAHDWHMAGVPYPEAVAAADAALGELLDELAARGLREGTAVVVTSVSGFSR